MVPDSVGKNSLNSLYGIKWDVLDWHNSIILVKLSDELNFVLMDF